MNSAVISKHTFTTLRQKFKFFGRAEIDELEKILVPGESILEVLNGFYTGGFALLCATNLRLLLIDKKPFILTVEDVRYDTVNEIDYHGRVMDASAIIHTPSKQMKFTSWRQRDLRSLVTFVQRHIMQLRQQSAQQAMMTQPMYARHAVGSALQNFSQNYDQSQLQTQYQEEQPVQQQAAAPAVYQPVAKVEANTFDEASVRRLASILRRPRVGKFLLSQ